jgi:hypothetical protein
MPGGKSGKPSKGSENARSSNGAVPTPVRVLLPRQATEGRSLTGIVPPCKHPRNWTLSTLIDRLAAVGCDVALDDGKAALQ